MAITYEVVYPGPIAYTRIKVFLDGKFTGYIESNAARVQWRYRPTHTKPKMWSEWFESLEACKTSLEDVALSTPDCQHSPGEDCMNCQKCGKCKEMLDEDDICDECRDNPQALSGRPVQNLDEHETFSAPDGTQVSTFQSPMVEVIDITPEALKTPEGVKRAEQAQKEWDDATHELANYLKRVIDDIFDRDLDKIARAEYYSELQTMIGIRDVKQEAFMKAVTGR